MIGRPNSRATRRARRSQRAAILVGLVAVAAAVIAVAAGARAHSRDRPQRHHTIVVAPRQTRPASPAGPTLARLDAVGIGRIEALAKLGLPIYCGGHRGNEVAFTFDDGPGPYTFLALRKLGQAHERATFFVVGRSMRNWPGWVQRELALAAIGDHTMTHPFLPELSTAEITVQIAEARTMIEQATGQPVYLFRPPYGSRTPNVDAVVRSLGLLEILWSDDSADSLGANWARIVRNVEAGFHPGEIILMHENRGQTIRALTTLLPALHRHHLVSVSLPELFATDPPSVAQIREGTRGCVMAGGLGSGG